MSTKGDERTRIPHLNIVPKLQEQMMKVVDTVNVQRKLTNKKRNTTQDKKD